MKVYIVKAYDTVEDLSWVIRVFSTEEKVKRFIYLACLFQISGAKDCFYEEWEVD